MSIAASDVKALRERTGAGMMDCKKALVETEGNLESAVDLLRKKGLAAAAKKAGRIASEGVVQAYIHQGSRIGVLVEVNCETDFVARNEQFQELARNISMQIAAANPSWVRREDVPKDVLAREMTIYKEQAQASGKPEQVIEKIATGKLEKFYGESCLVEQKYIKDDKQTVTDLLRAQISKLGENLSIRRFVRFEVGEGLEKRQDNLAEEVAKAVS